MAEQDEHKTTGTQEETQVKNAQRKSLWNSLFTEGEAENGESKSLKEVVQSMNIDGRWFFRQIPLLLLILCGILLMVTNRYQAQQEIIEKEELQHAVEDWRFRSLTRSSELTTRTRQSKIEEQLKALGDSILAPATEPPFTISPND